MATHDAQISVRIGQTEKELVEKVSSDRGEGVSSFARLAIKKELASLGFLSPEERRALGS